MYIYISFLWYTNTCAGLQSQILFVTFDTFAEYADTCIPITPFAYKIECLSALFDEEISLAVQAAQTAYNHELNKRENNHLESE